MSHPTFEQYLTEQAAVNGGVAGDKNPLQEDPKNGGKLPVQGTPEEIATHVSEEDGVANPKDGTGKPLTGADKAAAEQGADKLTATP